MRVKAWGAISLIAPLLYLGSVHAAESSRIEGLKAYTLMDFMGNTVLEQFNQAIKGIEETKFPLKGYEQIKAFCQTGRLLDMPIEEVIGLYKKMEQLHDMDMSTEIKQLNSGVARSAACVLYSADVVHPKGIVGSVYHQKFEQLVDQQKFTQAVQQQELWLQQLRSTKISDLKGNPDIKKSYHDMVDGLINARKSSLEEVRRLVNNYQNQAQSPSSVMVEFSAPCGSLVCPASIESLTGGPARIPDRFYGRSTSLHDDGRGIAGSYAYTIKVHKDKLCSGNFTISSGSKFVYVTVYDHNCQGSVNQH